MKLEEGMYVRTKRDGIGKIISLSFGEEDECCFIELSNRRTGTKEHNILKVSYNIIDLIEKGDILKFKDTKHYQEVLSIDNERLYLTEYIYMSGLEKYKKEIEEDLEWVITHEQIENMKYEVK